MESFVASTAVTVDAASERAGRLRAFGEEEEKEEQRETAREQRSLDAIGG